MPTTRRHIDVYGESDSGDFIIRRRLPAAVHLALLFFICYSVLYAVVINVDMIGEVVAGIVLLGVIGPLSWFTIYFAQQNRDMLLATEFQNALFSAAARLKTKFCMIVKRDGTVVYLDREFQRVFPETENRGTLVLDKIFNNKNIAPAEAEKIFNALQNEVSTSVFIDIQDENAPESAPERVIITIDPLPRPHGYFILRGRDYVVKKFERQAQADEGVSEIVDPSSAATVSNMLHTLPFGIYTTDTEGRIQFMNYRLEGWLGYDQHEVASRKLTLHDVISQPNTEVASQLLLKDCEGDISFRNRQGHRVKLYLKQEIARDGNGVVGSVGFVQQPRIDSEDITASDNPSADF